MRFKKSLRNLNRNSIKTILIKSIYYKKVVRNRGIYILEENWDNLIILDGCRFDVFKEHNNIPGKLEWRTSRGSCTNQFLKENFPEKKYPNVVYVTANPLVNYHLSGKFYKIDSVWDDGWNEEFGTVMPEIMVKRTIQARKKHPDKRIISHFVQPHYPYIGRWARKNLGTHEGMKSIYFFKRGDNTDHGAQLVWNLLKRGDIKKVTLWRAYVENLQVVLPHVKNLVKKLQGKTIITTDHGNLFGEWLWPFPVREYGHPCGVYKPNLVKIPWLIIEGKKQNKNIKN